MSKRAEKLDRLLRAAAVPEDAQPSEAPFGFDTRVVALWRSQPARNGTGFWESARIFRHVATAALIVTTCVGAAAFWELRQNEELGEVSANEYAIADSAIEAGTWQ